jgi:hypothetical protein
MGSDVDEPDLDLFIEFILITLQKNDQPGGAVTWAQRVAQQAKRLPSTAPIDSACPSSCRTQLHRKDETGSGHLRFPTLLRWPARSQLRDSSSALAGGTTMVRNSVHPISHLSSLLLRKTECHWKKVSVAVTCSGGNRIAGVRQWIALLSVQNTLSCYNGAMRIVF